MALGQSAATILSGPHAALYVYDPAPTLCASKAPLLAIFGELDSSEGVKANVSAIRRGAGITP
jgi:hypothetical protein